MLLHLPAVLNAAEVAQAQSLLDTAPWGDGRATAGEQSAKVKNNQQLPAEGEPTRSLQRLVLAALDRHVLFFSAALPRRLIPPMFNRYAGATNTFGNHVDNAVRYLPGSSQRVRTDMSCTLFLNQPADYEGGELVIQDSHSTPHIKFAAGDAVLYAGTSVHRVEPVTRGERLACFFWIESMVRSAEQRAMLFDMDRQLMQLRSELGETRAAAIALTGTYHNLLRMWADV